MARQPTHPPASVRIASEATHAWFPCRLNLGRPLSSNQATEAGLGKPSGLGCVDGPVPLHAHTNTRHISTRPHVGATEAATRVVWREEARRVSFFSSKIKETRHFVPSLLSFAIAFKPRNTSTLTHLLCLRRTGISLQMESKKPISFAAAAAAAAAKPAPMPASGTSTPPAGSASSASASAPAPAPVPVTATAPGKNGSNGAAAQSPPAVGSQSPATPSAIATPDKAISSGSIDWVLGKHVKVVTQSDEVFEGQVYAYDVLMNCVVLQCPSKSAAPAVTPSAYYSPSANNSAGNNGTVRPRYDFRILKINYIKDVTPITPSPEQLGVAGQALPSISTKSNNGSVVTSPNPESLDGNNITNNIYSTVVPAVGYIQLEKIQQREQQAIRDAQVAAARIGVGVSSTAQDIFDALSKTLPCRWAKDSIVVMDEVIIAPPYEPENCKANASASYTLARVKKVLEGERFRLANGRK